MRKFFTIRGKDFVELGNVEYYPLIYIVGTETHSLALHRELNDSPSEMKQWKVSHPIIGASVTTVHGTYKGVPCASSGFATMQARSAAIATLDAMLERIGSDKFNAVIQSQLDRFNALQSEVSGAK